jgi:hypothetical protein
MGPSSWNHADLVGSDDEAPEFGLDVEDTVLWDDEEVAVCGVERFVLLHILPCCVYEVSHAGFGSRVTIASNKV